MTVDLLHAGSEEPDDEWKLGLPSLSTGCSPSEPDARQHAAFHANDLYGIYDSLATMPLEPIAASLELQKPRGNEVPSTPGNEAEAPSKPSGASEASGQEHCLQPSAPQVDPSAADPAAAAAAAASDASYTREEHVHEHWHHDGPFKAFQAATPPVQSILLAGSIPGALSFPVLCCH